jgi:stage V sporulation protein D (sporulation-specific penicillin-binding protein)
MFSCNDALMQIVTQEGKDIFHRYQSSFGFGAKTGIDLPGEAAGIIFPLENLKITELATSSFGQAFNTTMIQMAAAFSSLVNGGNYYEPRVVKQIVNDSGATVEEFDQLLVRQTVSEETSEFIQKYMYQTVEAGTAHGAHVEGYSIGGKTGTAQKLPRDAKTYVVSFLGCAPAINPEMVIYVMIDEPQNVVKQADSSIATKFAGRIMAEILPVLGIYPEGEIDYLLPSEDDILAEEGGAGNTTESDAQEDTQNQTSEETDSSDDADNTDDTDNTDNFDDIGSNDNSEATNQNGSQDDSTSDNQEDTQNGAQGEEQPDGTENSDSQTEQDNTGDNDQNASQVESDEFNADALD